MVAVAPGKTLRYQRREGSSGQGRHADDEQGSSEAGVETERSARLAES
jgi:hypothetical protein